MGAALLSRLPGTDWRLGRAPWHCVALLGGLGQGGGRGGRVAAPAGIPRGGARGQGGPDRGGGRGQGRGCTAAAYGGHNGAQLLQLRVLRLHSLRAQAAGGECRGLVQGVGALEARGHVCMHTGAVHAWLSRAGTSQMGVCE